MRTPPHDIERCAEGHRHDEKIETAVVLVYVLHADTRAVSNSYSHAKSSCEEELDNLLERVIEKKILRGDCMSDKHVQGAGVGVGWEQQKRKLNVEV